MNELFQQLLLEEKLEDELYKIHKEEGASEVLPAAQPIMEDVLPAVDNATATLLPMKI